MKNVYGYLYFYHATMPKDQLDFTPGQAFFLLKTAKHDNVLKIPKSLADSCLHGSCLAP